MAVFRRAIVGPGGGALRVTLLLRILVIVGLLEVAVMVMLRFVPLEHFGRDVIDAVLLALLSSPLLYWLVVKPVGDLATEAERVRSALDHERETRALRELAEAERAEMEAQLRQSQKMDAVGRLAGGLAHDLNNLLTPILSGSELLLADWDTGEARREDVQGIQEAARRAGSLTKRLLSFSRMQPRRSTRLALEEVVQDMEGLLSKILGADIALATAFDADLPMIEADPLHMEQVILNLAVNARDAMPDGGRFSIETRSVAEGAPVPPPIDGRLGSYRVMLAASDTGSGMDESTCVRIFEPFFTTKDADKGTGLGLSTVYGIVRQCGGDITVESCLGEGSTFRIYFPAAGPAEVVEEVPPEGGAGAGATGGHDTNERPAGRAWDGWEAAGSPSPS
ncbi:MAG: sensor histidine kinase [Thermoleophilia bacterium]